MVSAIRDTEAALGTGEKRVSDVERELHDKARRAIHAVEDIAAGEELTADNVKVLRPGDREPGLHPKLYDEVVGKRATTNIQMGSGIDSKDVSDHDS
jgi:N-acetylneuraminate synthase